jgi:hypothetical protein
MPITVTTLLTQNLNLPNGDHVFGPATLGVGVSGFNVTLTTSQWTAGKQLTVLTEVSFDGGASFLTVASEGPLVPPFFNRDGSAASLLKMGWSVPDEQNPNRQIRVTTTVVNGPLRTTVTVEATSFSG